MNTKTTILGAEAVQSPLLYFLSKSNPLVVGYLRLPQIIGNSKANPPIPPLIPVSKSSWWKGVKEGRFPPPVKLGPRTTVWRAADIYKMIDGDRDVQP